MTVKPFRFGVLMSAVESRHRSAITSPDAFRRRVQWLEELGFDVLCVPDHLGSVAPLPALVAAADASASIRLGTCVLNAGFYHPVLLRRDALQVHQLSGGRFELGLGAGYDPSEFGVMHPGLSSGRARVDHLDRVARHLTEHLPQLPLMIAGNGDRLLSVAARRAWTIGLTGQPGGPGTPDPLADRVRAIRQAASRRFSELELNLLVAGVPTDGSGRADLRLARRRLPESSDDTLSALPGVFHGTATDIADTLRQYRIRYSISYFTVMDFHAEHFAPVMAQLR
jgi:probable F420-dependent oxidoreductase